MAFPISSNLSTSLEGVRLALLTKDHADEYLDLIQANREITHGNQVSVTVVTRLGFELARGSPRTSASCGASMLELRHEDGVAGCREVAG